MYNNRTIEQTIFISPDSTYIYFQQDGECYGAKDDVIQNLDSTMPPTFSLVLPGISEWWQCYVKATDFANSKTDCNFNWKRWHREGLIFAKELYWRLPRNYNLIYEPPVEDDSGTLSQVDFAQDDVDSIITKLGSEDHSLRLVPSYKYLMGFSLHNENTTGLSITFRAGDRAVWVRTRRNKDLEYIRRWMERIILNKEDVCQVTVFNVGVCYLQMLPQRVGQFTEMGQFRIINEKGEVVLNAYVDRREFVKGLYLSLLTQYGFGIYDTRRSSEVGYPQGEQRVRCWTPYNNLRSDIIEWFITDELFGHTPMPTKTGYRFINDSVVMYPYLEACLWDTMGSGSGHEMSIDLDSFSAELNIPELEDWLYPHPSQAEEGFDYDTWWLLGWHAAIKLRKILPPNVDLFYMGYDTNKPHSCTGYSRNEPSVIVPLQLAEKN